MNPRRPSRRLVRIAALAALTATTLAAADAARTRPGSARGGSGSGATRASGTATYGHRAGHHHGHFHGRYGHHAYGGLHYYGDPFWFGPYWGWWPQPRPLALGAIVPGKTAPAVIETDLRPRRAEVWIDGRMLGQARDFDGRWDRLWIPPGEHVVEFRKEGYQTLRRPVVLPPAGFLRIEERLQRGAGPDPRSTAEEPIVEAAPPTPAASGSERQRPALRRGLLHIEVLPADAAVYLDGEFLAHGDELARLHGAIPVAEGAHLVEVVRPGYAARSVEVEVAGGEPVRLTVDLRAETESGD